MTMAVRICKVSPIPYCPFCIRYRRSRRLFLCASQTKLSRRGQKYSKTQYVTNYKQNIKFWQSFSDHLLYFYPRLFHFCVIHSPAINPDHGITRHYYRREIEITQFFIIRHIY